MQTISLSLSELLEKISELKKNFILFMLCAAKVQGLENSDKKKVRQYFCRNILEMASEYSLLGRRKISFYDKVDRREVIVEIATELYLKKLQDCIVTSNGSIFRLIKEHSLKRVKKNILNVYSLPDPKEWHDDLSRYNVFDNFAIPVQLSGETSWLPGFTRESISKEFKGFKNSLEAIIYDCNNFAAGHTVIKDWNSEKDSIVYYGNLFRTPNVN